MSESSGRGVLRSADNLVGLMNPSAVAAPTSTTSAKTSAQKWVRSRALVGPAGSGSSGRSPASTTSAIKSLQWFKKRRTRC